MLNKIQSLLYENSISWSDSNKIILDLENEFKNKKNIDDILIGLFEGENKKKIRLYKNKTLLDTVLLCFVWHRIHRRVLWDDSTEIYIPVPEKLKKVAVIINRVAFSLPLDSPLLCFSRFLILCLSCKYHDSYKLIREIKIPKGCYLNAYISGVKSFKFFKYDPDIPVIEYYLPLFDKQCTENGAVILVSCDQLYFDRFHNDFLKSARKKGIKNTIVFVVVNEFEMVSYNKDENFYKIDLQLSYERSPALYASARFLFAREIMKKFNNGVFVFDIDFDFSMISQKDMDKISSYDIGLSFNKYGRSYVPWSNISAAACYFSYSLVSDFFLKVFCFYFREVYKKETWWIDQNSLFYSYSYVRFLNPSLRCFNMIEVRDKGVTNNLSSVKNFKIKFNRG